MSASKRKGTAAETAVVNYLHEHGYPCAERRALAGINDRGDIAGIPDVCIEIKSCARTELAAWIDELSIEMINARAHTGAVVHKRRGKGDPAEWFATMRFEDYVDLINRAGY